MSLTPSNMLPLGIKAPDFMLHNVINGENITLSDYTKGKAFVVAFICNHCPYVKHIIDKFVTLGNEYTGKGLSFIAISSNDVITYPDDSPENMKILALEKGFNFPYCYDETQEVAKKYDAACTPDFYLFNAKHILVYHGQFDSSRHGVKHIDSAEKGSSLESAVANVFHNLVVPNAHQTPSIGCNIKWKENIVNPDQLELDLENE